MTAIRRRKKDRPPKPPKPAKAVRPVRRPGRVRRALVGASDPFVHLLDPQHRNPGPRWLLLLVMLAAFAMFWIAFGTAGTTYDVGVTGYAPFVFVALLVAGPLLFVLTRPLQALMFSVATAFVLGVVLPDAADAPWPWLVVQGLIMFALLFATGIRRSLPEALGAWFLTVLLFWWGLPRAEADGWAVGLAIIVLFGVLTGRLVRARQELRVQTEVSESERALRRVLEERARLARDLHDIVAHHMSLVVVQAETAQYRVPGLGDAAREELLSISETARSALTETRGLLSVLRQENTQAENAPQPGLHLLDDLVESSRRAGVDLEVRITGDLGVLREGRSLTGFRIMQEALANASRHAQGAPVRLEGHGDARGVDLAVLSGLPGQSETHVAGLPRSADDRLGWLEVGVAPETGHGIIGMRERAVAVGGRLQVGPVAQGFLVQLFLPSDAPDGVRSGGNRSGGKRDEGTA
ncbi:sensor histidine kinase [Kineosporia babensis]|uniref:histidine kinase n=1 Tax=Kineosporia babensis TaxID=499548 RepID=A0A9X1SVB1_9ACTN|nr:histidine kinase [Kineosporia babensis]MCD5313451.1 histidine kinase [Kineosporia babensis]